MNFNEKMDEYIKRAGIPKSVLANIVGRQERAIDRGYKFLKNNSEKYKMLCSFLSLSQGERRELDELYIKTQFSSEEFMIIDLINEMLIDFESIFSSDEQQQRRIVDFEKKSAVEHEENIYDYILSVIQSCDGEECKIDICIKKPLSGVIKLLSDELMFNDKIKLRVVTDFDNGMNETKIKSSIQKLHSLIPLFKFPYNVDFKFFYTSSSQYDFQFPLSIIINSNVIAVNNDFSCAIHYDEKEIVALFKAQFENLYRFSEPLADIKNVFETLNEVITFDPEIELYCGQASCCIYKYIPIEAADKYIRQDLPDRETIVAMAKQYMSAAKNPNKKLKVLFSRGGIREFLKTGQVCDLPINIVNPIDLNDRCLVLKNLISEINSTEEHYNQMLKENLLNLTFTNQFSINSVGKVAVISYVHPKYNNMYVTIHEEYINYAVLMYFKYLEKSNLAYSQIEMVRYLTNLLDEFQQRGTNTDE